MLSKVYLILADMKFFLLRRKNLCIHSGILDTVKHKHYFPFIKHKILMLIL